MSEKIIKCNICGEEKELAGKGMCKSCYNKKYWQENKEHFKEQRKKYWQENKEHFKEQRKKYYEENKEYFKKYYEENKEHINEQRKKYWQENIESCRKRSRKNSYARGAKPMSENKDCALFLGVHVAEQVLSKVFKDVHLMPNGNPGFDFKCNKGMKVDAKSSVLHTHKKYKKTEGFWEFHIGKNTIADYFLCLAFDNREDLNPMYIWLIPGEEVNHLVGASIAKSKTSKWKKYELDINKVVNCCDTMRNR